MGAMQLSPLALLSPGTLPSTTAHWLNNLLLGITKVVAVVSSPFAGLDQEA